MSFFILVTIIRLPNSSNVYKILYSTPNEFFAKTLQRASWVGHQCFSIPANFSMFYQGFKFYLNFKFSVFWFLIFLMNQSPLVNSDRFNILYHLEDNMHLPQFIVWNVFTPTGSLFSGTLFLMRRHRSRIFIFIYRCYIIRSTWKWFPGTYFTFKRVNNSLIYRSWHNWRNITWRG